jgi:hypothetical protein
MRRSTEDPTPATWDAAVGPDPMVLPDGEVRGTTVDDWTALLSRLLGLGWSVGWKRGDGEERPLPAARLFAVGPDEPRGVIEARSPEGLMILFWAFAPSSIDFDLDLRELAETRRWRAFLAFVREVGAVTGRDVTLREEGSGPVFAIFHAATAAWSLRDASTAER